MIIRVSFFWSILEFCRSTDASLLMKLVITFNHSRNDCKSWRWRCIYWTQFLAKQVITVQSRSKKTATVNFQLKYKSRFWKTTTWFTSPLAAWRRSLACFVAFWASYSKMGWMSLTQTFPRVKSLSCMCFMWRWKSHICKWFCFCLVIRTSLIFNYKQIFITLCESEPKTPPLHYFSQGGVVQVRI